MKIRCSHVSNSSSSSFVIMGVFISEDEIGELEYFQKRFDEEGSDNYDYIEEFVRDEIWEMENLTAETFDGADGYYIGLSYSQMDENETVAQFRDRVKGLIESTLGLKDVKVDWMQECYYN